VFLVMVGAAILVCIYRVVMLMVRTEHDEDVLAKVTLFFLTADFLGTFLSDKFNTCHQFFLLWVGKIFY
jgi:hypothetical protein